MNKNNIIDQIYSDINDEFEQIKSNLEIQLTSDMKVKFIKEYITRNIPKDILSSLDLLLDTLNNYLMKEARKDLDKADISIQNSFYSSNFRNKTRKWAKTETIKIYIANNKINYSLDPRIKEGGKAASLPLISGTFITILLGFATTKIVTTSAGLATVLASYLSFKNKYEKSKHLAINSIRNDINQYLDVVEEQIRKKLKETIDIFNDKFIEFCKEHNYEPNRGIR